MAHALDTLGNFGGGKVIRLIGVSTMCLLVGFVQLSWGARSNPMRFKGFVKIASGRELYVDWVKTEPGKPTVVLLNGLTYSTKYWDAFTEAMAAKGVGVLRYDMYGMGNTLINDAHNAMTESPFAAFEANIYRALGVPPDQIDKLVHSPVLKGIKIEDQVNDLKLLLDKLKMTDKVNLVGLSYGGAVGIEFSSQYPDRVGNLVAQAPYTEAMGEQVETIGRLINWTRVMFPYNPATDRMLYDFWLRYLVYTTYPSVEPSVLDNPFKLEATYRLAQGATDWKASAFVKDLPPGAFHLMIAGNDQYIKTGVLEKLWTEVPVASRGSRVLVNGSEHKMPEAFPAFVASYVYEIISGNPVIANGTVFDANPRTGVLRYPGGELRLSVDYRIPRLRAADIAPQERLREILNVQFPSPRVSCYAAHASLL